MYKFYNLIVNLYLILIFNLLKFKKLQTNFHKTILKINNNNFNGKRILSNKSIFICNKREIKKF